MFREERKRQTDADAMNPVPISAQQALLNARQALQSGDRQAARRWAEIAAADSPELEEPWLILAALASPRASISYLERALIINPTSQRARKGMHWAVERLRKENASKPLNPEPLADTQPSRTVRLSTTQQAATQPTATRPTPIRRLSPTVPTEVLPVGPRQSRSITKYQWSFLSLILVVVCISAVWVFWPGNVSPVRAFLHVPLFTQMAFGGPAQLGKPSYTPTFTATYTPTETFTPTATFTNTPSPTNTIPPTATPVPTNTFVPTRTPRPVPTAIPYNPNPGSSGERWIDVNLSQQMLYAYEGNTVVASFLVSTGVPAFPTVTGQYHIYIKLVSTLMAGDGYYLPDVPYTMYFYKGYGIHGTYWHHNFGHPMSHGCVNMYTPDAEWMFYWASVGTLVNVHY